MVENALTVAHGYQANLFVVLYSELGLTWNQYERGMHRAATNVLTKTGYFPSAETRCQLPSLKLSKGGLKMKTAMATVG